MSHWIAGAIKRRGALKRKAKRAHLSVHAYAQRMQHAPGRTGKQARLALTLARFKHKRKARRSTSSR